MFLCLIIPSSTYRGPIIEFFFIFLIVYYHIDNNMPVSRKNTKGTKKTSKKTTRRGGKKRASSSFLPLPMGLSTMGVPNPADPFNQYPNHETGEEEYGPIPPFGFNKHDMMNMKPFNPNALSAVMGGPIAQPQVSLGGLLMPPPFNMLGIPGGLPNPNPLLQPIVPTVPTTPGVASLNALPSPGGFSMFPPVNYGYGYGGMATSQNYHPNDPNNQFPNPLTGSMTQPGPALEGGMNNYDPYNVIGAPVGTPAQNKAISQQMINQPRHPRSPYILK